MSLQERRSKLARRLSQMTGAQLYKEMSAKAGAKIKAVSEVAA